MTASTSATRSAATERAAESLEDKTLWKMAKKSAVHKTRKLCEKIAAAQAAGNWRQVKRLTQRSLRAFATRVASVQHVTEEAKGKLTAGVDGIVYKTDEARYELAVSLEKRTPFEALIEKEVPKDAGGTRVICVPTQRDRAQLRLANTLACAQARNQLHPDIYGAIPSRGRHAAVAKLAKYMYRRPVYCGKVDIQNFYPSIPHESLQGSIELTYDIQEVITELLALPIVCSTTKQKYTASLGVPQGAGLAALLGNIALHPFMEDFRKVANKIGRPNALTILYVDDLLIGHPEKLVVEELLAAAKEILSGNGYETHKETVMCSVQNATFSGGVEYMGLVFYQMPISMIEMPPSILNSILEGDTDVITRDTLWMHTYTGEGNQDASSFPTTWLNEKTAPTIHLYEGLYTQVMSTDERDGTGKGEGGELNEGQIRDLKSIAKAVQPWAKAERFNSWY